MCGCNKNQTPETVFEAIATSGHKLRSEETLGLGLFIVPAPENGILEYREVLVDKLTYNECLKRGSHCEAFQWIPYGVSITDHGETFTIGSLKEFNEVRPLYCNDSCRGGCPMGCTCFGNDTHCRRNS